MTYTLLRGSDLLGHVEIQQVDPKAVSGYLIPRDGTVPLRSETQMHMRAVEHLPASVWSMPEEPEVIDGPPRPNNPSGALQPATDDMKVDAQNELHLFNDDEEIRAHSVWLHEKRYFRDVPADMQLALPVGALRGHSYWEVTVFTETGTQETSDVDEPFTDDGNDEISP